jgi:hypothetical protein
MISIGTNCTTLLTPPTNIPISVVGLWADIRALPNIKNTLVFAVLYTFVTLKVVILSACQALITCRPEASLA